MAYGYLKWLALFGIEIAAVVYSANKSVDTSGVDMKTFESLKQIVAELSNIQQKNGMYTHFFFLAILGIIALQFIYFLAIACKRCMKKSMKRAVTEA